MDKKAIDPIKEFGQQRQTCSDEAILAELAALPILPDEEDPQWQDERTWLEIGYPYLALANIAAERCLRSALPLLFEKASYGDPFEIMRSVRHRLEQIVEPDWPVLTEICMKMAQSAYRGARLWAIDELGILRDKQSGQTLMDALDEASLIQHRACQSLAMLCQTNSDCRRPAIQSLARYLQGH